MKGVRTSASASRAHASVAAMRARTERSNVATELLIDGLARALDRGMSRDEAIHFALGYITGASDKCSEFEVLLGRFER